MDPTVDAIDVVLYLVACATYFAAGWYFRGRSDRARHARTHIRITR